MILFGAFICPAAGFTTVGPGGCFTANPTTPSIRTAATTTTTTTATTRTTITAATSVADATAPLAASGGGGSRSGVERFKLEALDLRTASKEAVREACDAFAKGFYRSPNQGR